MTIKSTNLSIRGIVAALTDGRVCDGCFVINEDGNEKPIKLYDHSVYRLISNTLEPVAGKGDILLVSNSEKINETHHNLVVTSVGGTLLARRYERVSGRPEIVALVSQAINPKDIKEPYVVPSESILENTKKIVGVFYSNKFPPVEVTGNEITPLDGEQVISDILKDAHLFEIKGRSAEPYALDGQYLIVGKPETDFSNIDSMDGEFVLAIDSDGQNLFKRMRIHNKKLISLESLDINGKEASLLFSSDESLGLPSIKQISHVKGVVFNLPANAVKKEAAA